MFEQNCMRHCFSTANPTDSTWSADRATLLPAACGRCRYDARHFVGMLRGKRVGSGFSTNEAISGSATTTLAAPPTATRTVNFGLTCINKGISSNASCTVQVAKPAIVLVANPKSVESGERASIGWVTASMKENGCVISSSNQPDFT